MRAAFVPHCARRVWFTRALITISPLSYREVLAWNLRNERPSIEVILASPDELDGAVERFRPHLVVCNTVSQKVRDTIPCWVEVLVHENLDANVSIYGLSSTLNDMKTEDFLQVIDEVERQLAGAT